MIFFIFLLQTDGQKAVSNVQPQGQVQAMQPAPVVMVPPPSLLSRFRWYHAALAVGVLAASGAGTAVFVKVPTDLKLLCYLHLYAEY